MRSLVLFFIVSLLVLAPAAANAQVAQAPLDPATAQTVLPVIDDAQVLDATKPRPAKVTRYTGACRKLPTSNPFVAAFRATCRAEGDAFSASLVLPTCKSAPRCRIRLKRYATDLGRQARTFRRLNVVIKTAVTGTECRSVLRKPKAVLLTVTRLRSAATRLAAATLVGGARVNRGISRFYAIDRAPLLDHRGQLDGFRASCL